MVLDKANCEEIKTDVLIIGSEAGGAKAAIDAYEAGVDVLVVTKGLIGKSGTTVMAGAGIQAPLDPRDSPDIFFEDVIKGGEYLNNQDLVEKLVNLATSEVLKLEEWGAKFAKKNNKYVLYAPPGATYPRSLFPAGGRGGVHFARALSSRVKRLNIKVLEDIFITRLLISDSEVAGAMGISLRSGHFIVLRAKNVILATGGCPQVYRFTDAAREATGDGLSMAFNAGAELMDMEFQQFFPMACYTPPFEMSQLPGALRYFLHGKFYNSEGEAFMERYMPVEKDWGMRDQTSRAIYLENKQGRGSPHGGAYIAVNHLPENLIDDWIEREKLSFVDDLAKVGIDIRKHAVECGPACHYSMGGVRVNENCETNLPRLYAAGEVATGMDGAERIDGGPAITWCLTMGYIAGKEAAKEAKKLGWLEIDPEQVNAEQDRVRLLFQRKEGIPGSEIINKIKDIMWEYCACVRDQSGLEKGLALIEEIKRNDLPRLSVPSSSPVYNKKLVEALEATHIVQLSEMIVRSALMRQDTRRSHYRTDFPELNNKDWLKNIIIKNEGGEMSFSTASPVLSRMKP